MTVIIGSLFLPYTVQFEIGSDQTSQFSFANDAVNQPNANVKSKRQQSSSSVTRPIAITQSSILPSLSESNSGFKTGSPVKYEGTLGKVGPEVSESAEEFFNTERPRNNPETHSAQVSNERSSPQYIQPRARLINLPFKSLVIDQKREKEEMALPSLKISRSTTNLPGSASNSYANLSAMNLTGPTPIPQRGKPFGGPLFTLHEDESANSLSDYISTSKGEEKLNDSDDEGYFQNFNDLSHGRGDTKLAQFGGFSKPDLESTIFNKENIFEHAPWKIVLAGKGNLSLTKAVKDSVDAEIIKENKWVGTLAMPSDEVSDKVIGNIATELSKSYNSEAVFPNDITFQGHYKSFCKQILWPTLHYQIPDDPKSKAFEDHSWCHYKLLNQLVADKIVGVYKKENGNSDPNDPENIIWIHDYHLLLVPQMIREQLPEAKIGLFLHVSFPSSEVFRCFAQRRALLKGMLGANCITFQTEEYVRHFFQTCNRLLLADTTEFGVSFEGNFTMVNTISVGINSNALEKILKSEDVLDWRNMIRERWGDRKLIVSRDKLDRLRGIKQKLLAYESFLRNHPQYIDKAVLIQICPGSVQDAAYESEVMSIVSRINSLTKDIAFSQPVILLQQDIKFEQYLALQCEAEVFVISSMREGLNLTCHEFIVASNEKHSPLLLSEFTGSSPILRCNGQGAILVNPWDIKEFAEKLKYLLELEPEEKDQRWSNCFNTVRTHNSLFWVRSCLEGINEAWDYDQRRSLNKLIPLTEETFSSLYSHSKDGKRLFFLNLDAPSAVSAFNDGNQALNKIPSLSTINLARKSSTFTEPAVLASLLSNLLSDPSNEVYLISFMRRSDLDNLYKRTPNLGLIAENGGYIKLVGSSKWISIVDQTELKTWIPQVTQLIQAKVERLPGSHCEIEDCTIRFHPGSSLNENRERSFDVMGDLIQHINEMFLDKNGIHAVLIKDVVVVQQNQLFLKALKFVVAYYHQNLRGLEPDSLVQEYQIKQVPASMPTTPSTETPETPTLPSPSHKNSASLLFLSSGSTPSSEPCFEYANSLRKSGEIHSVSTVAILGADSRTSAEYFVSGRNELLGVLSNLKTYDS